jgi:hypothetical protein
METCRVNDGVCQIISFTRFTCLPSTVQFKIEGLPELPQLSDLVLSLLHLSDARFLVSTTLGLYAQSVISSMVEAQESMLKAILRNGSNAVN